MGQLFGVVLTAISSVFRETATVIGKQAINREKESIFSMGFLATVITALAFIVIAFWFEGGIKIDPASYTNIGIRIGSDIVISVISLIAIKKATRSTFSFFRLITVPLILVVDLVMGYAVSLQSMAGMMVVLLGLGYLFLSHGTSRKGVTWVLVQGVLAVFSFSIFKFNIDNYNTIASEQAVVVFALMLFYGFMAFGVRRESFKKVVLQRTHLGQSFMAALSGVLASFAFNYASPSVLVVVRRAGDAIMSVISGNIVFHEKHLRKKISALVIVTVGLILLGLG